jgi:hypothetical protein
MPIISNGLRLHRTQKLYQPPQSSLTSNREPITFAANCGDRHRQSRNKISAFKAHKPSLRWPLFEENIRKLGPQEMFHLAASTKAGPARQEKDLFEGVDPDG